MIASLEGHPEVLPIDGRVDRASWWHTDVTFLSTPPLGSILYMREVPDAGGDTMWISMQAAYDGLSETMRAFCDTLIAWHHDPFFAADVEAKGGYEWDGKHHERLLPDLAPRRERAPRDRSTKGLFVNPQFTRFLEGSHPARERDPARDALPPLHEASRNTAAGSTGGQDRSPSGTTGRRCTTRSTTTATRSGWPTG